jgi:hypothetical protein
MHYCSLSSQSDCVHAHEIYDWFHGKFNWAVDDSRGEESIVVGKEFGYKLGTLRWMRRRIKVEKG